MLRSTTASVLKFPGIAHQSCRSARTDIPRGERLLGLQAEVGEGAVTVPVKDQAGHLPIADREEIRRLGGDVGDLDPADPSAPLVSEKDENALIIECPDLVRNRAQVLPGPEQGRPGLAHLGASAPAPFIESADHLEVDGGISPIARAPVALLPGRIDRLDDLAIARHGYGPPSGSRRTASRIAAATAVAAAAPICIDPYSRISPWPEARQKTMSPSTGVKVGSIARAIPAVAARATTVHSVLLSAASVQMQASVVLPSGAALYCGAYSSATRCSAPRTISPSSPTGPTNSEPSSASTSPAAFTATTAATVSPAPVLIAA